MTWTGPLAEALDVLKIHDSPPWRAWLARTLDEGNGLGSDLVVELPGPDTRATAGRLLKAAEALGWIGRGRFAPCQSQQFFDSGGWHKTEEGRRFHAECWTWSVSSEHRDTVLAYAGEHKRDALTIGDRVRYSAGLLTSLGHSAAKSRGTLVGFKRIGDTIFPLVSWDDDPTTERVCEDQINDTTCRARLGTCRSCPTQPFRPRPVSAKGIRRA